MSWISKLTPLIFTAVLAMSLATGWAMRKHRSLERVQANVLDRMTARLIGDDNDLRYRQYRQDRRSSSYPLEVEYGDRGRAMRKGGYKYHFFRHQWMDPAVAEGVDEKVVKESLSYHLWKLESGPTYVAGIAASLVAIATTVAINLANVPEESPWVYVFTYVVPFFFITIPLVLYLMRLRDRSYWETLKRAAGPEYALVELKRQLEALLLKKAQGAEGDGGLREGIAIVNTKLKDLRKGGPLASADADDVAKEVNAVLDDDDKVAKERVESFKTKAGELQPLQAKIEAAMAREQREKEAERMERRAQNAARSRLRSFVRQRMLQQKVAAAEVAMAEAAATKIGALFRGRQARAEVEERAREVQRELERKAADAAATSAGEGALAALEETLALANAISRDLLVVATEASKKAGDDEAAAKAEVQSAMDTLQDLTAAAKKAKKVKKRSAEERKACEEFPGTTGLGYFSKKFYAPTATPFELREAMNHFSDCLDKLGESAADEKSKKRILAKMGHLTRLLQRHETGK